MSLEEYVTSAKSEGNSQTLFLSGVELDHQLAGEATGVDSGEVDPDWLLARAQTNISQNIAVTGLAEQFDESLLLLRQEFGWQHLYYARLNSARRGNREPPPARVSEAIAEHNQLDLALYAYATQVMRERLDRLRFDVPSELRRFRRRNAVLGRLSAYPTWVIQRVYQRFATASVRR